MSCPPLKSDVAGPCKPTLPCHGHQRTRVLIRVRDTREGKLAHESRSKLCIARLGVPWRICERTTYRVALEPNAADQYDHFGTQITNSFLLCSDATADHTAAQGGFR